ncbi:hypothetical protein QJQ45_011310 [Haematococcus lacustris]|nr:hypothetical protein QJQ45_011310 [Haematococcus lacustris]
MARSTAPCHSGAQSLIVFAQLAKGWKQSAFKQFHAGLQQQYQNANAKVGFTSSVQIANHDKQRCSHKQPAEQLDHNAVEGCSRGPRKLPPLRLGAEPLVLNPDFWEKNEWIVGTLAPAAKLVEAIQADAANLARVHFGLMAVEDKLDKVTSDGYMVKMNLSPSIFHPRLLRDPVTWWEWYGKKTPVLQQVAQRVLSIPATSAGVERLFSVFKFIWSDRRNRLLMGRMWAMAYVYFNTRALRHLEEPMADDAADVARWEEWMASQPVEGAPLLSYDPAEASEDNAQLKDSKKTRVELS